MLCSYRKFGLKEYTYLFNCSEIVGGNLKLKLLSIPYYTFAEKCFSKVVSHILSISRRGINYFSLTVLLNDKRNRAQISTGWKNCNYMLLFTPKKAQPNPYYHIHYIAISVISPYLLLRVAEQLRKLLSHRSYYLKKLDPAHRIENFFRTIYNYTLQQLHITQ